MEKLEYKTRIEEMKALVEDKKFNDALDIADSINWRKVLNINELLSGSKTYEACGKIQEARDLLLLAHERSPIGRVILYRLCKISIKLEDMDAAQQYYNEFVQIAPHDSQKYILKYHLAVAKKCDDSVLIKILEQLKEQDFIEEWAYELAYLYHQANMSDKCVEMCDEIILWFGDGPIVERALELKMLYQPLGKSQEDKYRHLQQEKNGITEIEANEPLLSGEIIPHTITIPSVELSPERFNTVNLQAEIKKSIEEIMKATEAGEVSENMEAIKTLVEEIPYLQVPEEEPVIEDAEEPASVNDMFKAYLAEEYDGQISLLLPDASPAEEEQIKGQMTIDDVMAEWEKTRRAAEQALEDARIKELRMAKARALREAQNVLNRLEEAMPLLDAGISPVELLKEEYLSTPIKDVLSYEGAGFAIPRVDINGEAVGTMEIPVIDKASADVLYDDKGMPAVVKNVKVEEDTASWNPPAMEGQVESLRNASTLLEASDMLADVNLMLQKEIERLTNFEEKKETDTELIQEEIPFDEMAKEKDIELPVIELPEDLFSEEEMASYEENEIKETQSEENFDMSDAIEAALELELKEALKEETKDATPLPIIEQSVLEPEEIAELVDEKVLERAIVEEKSTIDLDSEDMKIFSYFLPLAGMQASIRQVVTGAAAHITDENHTSGNIVIVGESGCGKTQMATSIIKVLQRKTGKPKGGVGKISGEKLNEKDIQTLFEKIQGGCLIIEEAGHISRDTAVTLSLLMEQDKKGTIIIMEDNRKGIEKALAKDASYGKRFTEKIVIPVFSIDELVEFGKTYGEEAGYTIDDMGVLALYNRINLVGRFDYATTIRDVTEIMDEAFRRASKGGLFSRPKVDREGRIVLKEKDFE
ncbi:MAG: ATP-binding protein [Pseudobutyrivibrio sp.]|nr:ATP-binding protein [Pseudobutyrivibrio sp.]